MPGVLILEAMAQVGAVAILSLPENQGKIALFGGVKNARFRRKVIPGDRAGDGVRPHQAPGPRGHRRVQGHCGRPARLHGGADLRHQRGVMGSAAVPERKNRPERGPAVC